MTPNKSSTIRKPQEVLRGQRVSRILSGSLRCSSLRTQGLHPSPSTRRPLSVSPLVPSHRVSDGSSCQLPRTLDPETERTEGPKDRTEPRRVSVRTGTAQRLGFVSTQAGLRPQPKQVGVGDGRLRGRILVVHTSQTSSFDKPKCVTS